MLNAVCSIEKSELEKLEKNSKDDQRYKIIPIWERLHNRLFSLEKM